MPENALAVPGETPAAYLPEEPAQEGGRTRSPDEENSGRRRRLDYPPAPEPLPVPVMDNHTHLDFGDGDVSVTVRDALDAAEALGVKGAVQVGCDLESSR